MPLIVQGRTYIFSAGPLIGSTQGRKPDVIVDDAASIFRVIFPVEVEGFSVRGNDRHDFIVARIDCIAQIFRCRSKFEVFDQIYFCFDRCITVTDADGINMVPTRHANGVEDNFGRFDEVAGRCKTDMQHAGTFRNRSGQLIFVNEILTVLGIIQVDAADRTRVVTLSNCDLTNAGRFGKTYVDEFIHTILFIQGRPGARTVTVSGKNIRTTQG